LKIQGFALFFTHIKCYTKRSEKIMK